MLPENLLALSVSDVLDAAPACAHVFVRRGMSCVGCPFARFETVADVARNYGVDANELAASLLQVADETHPS